MKAKRLTILSALGSALVTRVPIDRCRSPSSHFRTPLHLLAISMRKSPIVADIRSRSSESGASHMVFVFTYLSCRIKNVILDFSSGAPRHVSICFSHDICARAFCYNDIHAMSSHGENDTSRTLYVYMYIYVAPGLHPTDAQPSQSYIRTDEYQYQGEENFPKKPSSTAGHQQEKLDSSLFRESQYYSPSLPFIYKIQGLSTGDGGGPRAPCRSGLVPHTTP